MKYLTKLYIRYHYVKTYLKVCWNGWGEFKRECEMFIKEEGYEKRT